jgi:hypothetical protein
MNKAAILLCVLGLASLGVSAGLWFSTPAPNTAALAKISQLQSQLDEAKSQIANLEAIIDSVEGQGTRATTAPAPVAAFQPASRSAAPPLANAMSPALLQPASATPTSDQPPAAPIDPKELKRLATAEALYADLISRFNLRPEEKEVFKNIVAGRADIKNNALARMADPTLSPVERQALFKQAQATMGENDAQLRQFLNDDQDYLKFLQWEQTGVERDLMESGRAIFDNDGSGLTQDQEDWLVQAAYELRHRTQGLADPYNLESMTDTTINQDYVNQVLAKFDQDTTLILQNARGRFNPTQLQSIQKWRHQARVSLESRLWNMSRTAGSQQR